MSEKESFDPIALVLGANEAYAMPLAVSLYSCLINLQPIELVNVYVIDDSISVQSKARIQHICDICPAKVNLEWIDASKTSLKLANMKTTDLFPPVVLLRLLIYECILPIFDRAIYIDSDLIVRTNIRNLWEVDLNNYALLAVEEFKHRRKNYKCLGISIEEPYFNSGVLVFNLNRWRQESITDKIIEYSIENSDCITMPDQDPLNAVLKGEWKELDLRWNVVSSFFYHDDWADSPRNMALWDQRKVLINEAYIYHFAGGSKPWQIGCEHPAQIEWVTYLIRSSWFKPSELFWWLSVWGAKYLKWRIFGGKPLSV